MKRILIVDDEKDIRETTQICLEITEEWEVLTASSGREGLLKAEQQHPDVILLDMMMPEMDGLTTLKNLQSKPQTQKIPVILLTAKTQAFERRQFTQLKIAALITKPYDPLTLSEEILAALMKL